MNELIIMGMLGGFAIQLVRFLSPEEQFDFASLKSYIPFVINIIVSGLVVYAFVHSSKAEVNHLLALYIGVAAPLILKSMSQAIPSGIFNGV